MATKLFDKAKKNKADEFYTRLYDIEIELKHYKNFFNGKVVFCNCDDPFESNFFKFFALNFNYFGLKKLIATCYDGSPISGTQLSILEDFQENDRTAYKIEITEVIDENNDGSTDLSDIEHLIKYKKNVLTKLEGNGDFRSSECISLLKEADIVVTNPPFSLFREYVSQLIQYNKLFIIMGNTNALTYKEIFRLFQDDKIRTGYTNFNVGMYFYVNDDIEEFHKLDENGKKMVRVSTSCWFTNLEVTKHFEYLTSYKSYSNSDYPKYENYDAINVDSYKEIPMNFDGKIGVPITFLDRYNPEQFEIVALGITGSIDFLNDRKMEILDKDGNGTGKTTINAKGTLYRKHLPSDKKSAAFRDCITGELYQSIYARVIIRRRGNAKN